MASEGRTDGWHEWSKHVLKSLENHDTKIDIHADQIGTLVPYEVFHAAIDKLTKDDTNQKITLAGLKVRWATLGAAIPISWAVLAWILSNIIKH